MKLSKIEKSVLICNAIEHLDTALYGFLAPIFAKLFFPQSNYLVQLLLTYSVLLSSAIIRPLGAYYFTRKVLNVPVLNCLKITVIGTSFATLLITCIPSYTSIGIFAPIILVSSRLLLYFFVAGEMAISIVFLLDNNSQPYKISSYYEASTMIGIIIASGMSALAIYIDSWRWCFIVSASSGLIVYILRNTATFIPSNTIVNKTVQKSTLLIVAIFINRLMNNITYAIPFILMNTLIPIVNHNITLQEMLSYNTLLLIIDMLLLVGCIKIKFNIKPRLLIAYSYGFLGITMPFLMTYTDTIYHITAVRLVIIICGVIAGIAQNVYYDQLFQNNSKNKYLYIGNAITLSDAIVGKSIPLLGIAFFHYTGSLSLIGVFIAIVSILCIAINYFAKPIIVI